MKLALNKSRRYRQFLNVCLACFLFIASQALAGAHASEHVFHDADASCVIFSVAENISTAGALLQTARLDYKSLTVATLSAAKAENKDIPTPYLSRSPPIFL